MQSVIDALDVANDVVFEANNKESDGVSVAENESDGDISSSEGGECDSDSSTSSTPYKTRLKTTRQFPQQRRLANWERLGAKVRSHPGDSSLLVREGRLGTSRVGSRCACVGDRRALVLVPECRCKTNLYQTDMLYCDVAAVDIPVLG